MADRGTWDKTELQFKKKEYQNKVEKENIMIARFEIEKREISLKIEELDLAIEKAESRKEEMEKQIKWCGEKIADLVANESTLYGDFDDGL